MRKRPGWLAGLVGTGLLILLGIWLLHPTIGPRLQTVSPAQLSQSGIVLLNPFPWDAPAISQTQAQQVAVRQSPGGRVIQMVLAEVLFTDQPSARAPRLCWLVSFPGSLIRSSGPAGSIQRTAGWYLILIDAHTGGFVQGVAGG